MNAFDKSKELKVYGRVQNLRGNVIRLSENSMTVALDQTYGDKCVRSLTVPVNDGYFEASLLRYVDNRNFRTNVRLDSYKNYKSAEQYIEYQNQIEETELFMQLQTTDQEDYRLDGQYQFRSINALDYTPVKDLEGEYSLSKLETTKWTSDKTGNSYIEHLKIGQTNIIIKNDLNYYDNEILGAKVLKSST